MRGPIRASSLRRSAASSSDSTPNRRWPSALEQLRRFHVRLAFVGTDGFSAQAGLTTHLVEGAEIVKSMAALADTTVVVADSSKYAKHGFVNVLQLSEVDILISDDGIEATKRAEITDLGVDLRLV